MPENLGVAKGYIELDLTKLKSAVETGESQLKKLEAAGKLTQSEFDKLKAQTDENASAFEKAAKKSEELSAKIDNTKQKSSQYKTEIQNLNSYISKCKTEQENLKNELQKAEKAYENSQKKVDALKKEYDEARKESEKLKQEFGENSKEAQDAAEKVEKLGKEYESAKQKTADYKNEITNLEGKHEALGKEIDDSGGKVVDFKTKLNQTEVELQGMQRELEQTQSKALLLGDEMVKQGDRIKRAGEKISNVGSVLTMGVTAPIVGAGTTFSKWAMDAEDSYAKVATIADLDVLNMDQIKDGVKDLSNEMGIGVADINEAMYQTISATADTANALDYVAIAAKAAKGGFTDTATAVDVLTTIMNSYGLEGEESMEKVADMMLMTQNYGKTTFGEMAQTLGGVVPIANAAGMSLEELFSTIAVLTRNGVQTDSAMVGVKGALTNIISPTKEAADAAEALGINFDAATLAEIGLPGVMREIKGALRNVAPEYVSLTDKISANYEQMSQMEAAGQKSSDAYKLIKKETAGLEQQLEILADAQGADIAGYSALFGNVRALNAMMVLASDNGMQDMNTAMDYMQDSAGKTNEAFEIMRDTTGSRLRKSLNEVKNRGIEIGEKLLPYVDKGIGFVGDLVDQFDSLSDKEQDQILKMMGIAAVAGPAMKLVGGITEGVGGIVGGIGDIIKKTGAVGGAATNAAGIATGAFGGFGGALAELASVAGPIALTVGAIVGIGLAVEAVDKKLTKDNLKKHFGDIKLSAEEIEDITDRLTTRDWTVKLDAEIAAREDLIAFEKEFRETIQRIDKTGWKVKAGLELTDAEKEAFKTDITSFITQSQTLLDQQYLTTTLAIDTLYEGDEEGKQNISELSTSVYTELQTDLTNLGIELSDITNAAFEDNFLDVDEMSAILEKKQEIQKIFDDLAEARYEVELDHITANAGELTAESFQDLQKSISDKIEERKASLDQTIIDAQVLAKYKLEHDPDYTQEQFDKEIASLEKQAQQEIGMLSLDMVNYEIETIQGNYDKATDEAGKQFGKDLKGTLQTNLDQAMAMGGIDLGSLQNTLETQFGALPNALSEREQKAVAELLENMKPEIAATEALYQSYVATGEQMPEGLREGLTDAYQMQALSGDIDAQYKLIAMQLEESPDLLTAITTATASGQEIPESLRMAMEELSPQIYDSTVGLLKEIQNGTEATEPELRTLFENLGIDASDDLINALAGKEAETQQETIKLLAQIQSGAALKEPELRSTLNSLGITASDSLITSLYSKEPAVQEQAISLLAQLQEADAEKRPEILAQLEDLGIKYDGSIITGMDGNAEEVNTSAAGVISGATDSMEAQAEADQGRMEQAGAGEGDAFTEGVAGATDGVHVGDVEIGTNNPESEAQSWLTRAQSWLYNNPLSVTIRSAISSISSRLSGYADGGIADEPAIFGEAGPEMAIPLSASKRTRALNLLSQTEQILGVNNRAFNAYNFAISPNVPQASTSGDSFNYRKLALELADVLRGAPITPQVQVEMRDGDVYIDKEKAGQKLAPVVTRIQNKKI